MTKFKVKNKHLVGKIKDFPKYIVQMMVDEQVNQGNPADPSVFADDLIAGQSADGFTWQDSELGHDLWADVINRKQFHHIPAPEKPKGHTHAKAIRKYAKDAMVNEKPWELWEYRTCDETPWQPLSSSPRWYPDIEYRRKSEAVAVPTPVPALTPNALIKAMLDKGMTVWACISDESYDDARTCMDKRIHRIAQVMDGVYPIQTDSGGWRYAVPVNTATMTEITELP